MNADYYALISKAVAGKDAAARDTIYTDARSLIRRSQMTHDAAASHEAALEDAIRQVEDELAAEDANSAAHVRELLEGKRSAKPLVYAASAIIAVGALAALAYGYFAGRGRVDASSQAPRRHSDAVVADLKPGVDGGSTGEGLPFAYQRQVVFYRTDIVAGSIVIDRDSRFLYLIDANNSARRYGIGIAQECQKGGSFLRVTNKMEWPDAQSQGASAKDADARLTPTGRPGSPLGARALLLDKPGMLIHGTNSPKTIGHLVASGCIRLVNDDVEDLYKRVSVETRVVFAS
jgi:lipoprotein-anchoring transpeptidase ErfK/SrfK